MRIVLTLALAALAGSSACAQSVTLFGLIDTAVERLDHVGPANSHLTRMPGFTGSVASRLGFRGSEDLGSGLKAIFTIEQGFMPDVGGLSQGGRSFGRQSFVGLSGDWGGLTFGRQYTMLYWSILDADVLGPNVHGSGSLDVTIPNARTDNALAYRGFFGGFSVGATYSLGRDAVNAGPSPAGSNCPGEQAADASACREWSALLKVDRPAWGAALAVDQIHGGPGAYAGLTSSALTDRHLSANGYLLAGPLKLSAGLIRRDNGGSPQTPRSDLWFVGGSYPVLPSWLVEAELFRLDYRQSDNGATLAAARTTYSLSKRTALYASLARIANRGALALSVSGGAVGGNPVAGAAQNGVAAGLRHAF